ncbi:MAG TPA: benzoate 1,2-dioxygenase electron transfer component BenC [Rhodopila sp.]|jgi:benzoate/toluate 1,2-dioxygenase reductase subunit|nr:benzoate 1,2-dioxygenase electron transfer component BenC [Rhodopila sp.]
MGHTIALNFEDGVTRFVQTRAGETVAEASYRVGINIPLDCGNGACGTCKCRVESGAFDPGNYIEDALSEEEATQGLALACQIVPESDMAVAVAASSAACKTKAQHVRTALRSVTHLSETAMAIAIGAPADFDFLPGQYVNVQVPGAAAQRSYSFSSAPGASELTFLVRDIPAGLMSTWLRNTAEPGTMLDVTGPAGAFYLRDIHRPALFLAGGTGLAPFLSMLGRLAEAGTPHPIHMVYGVTNDADLVAVDTLTAHAARIEGFTFTTCVATPGSEHPRKGYVTDHLAPETLNGGDVDIYLCGPPAMVDAVGQWLRQQGVTPANFYYEKFAPSGATAIDRQAA